MSTSPDIDVFGEAPEGVRPRIDLSAEHKPRIWARFLAKWIDFYLCLIPSFAIMMGLIFIYGFVATLLAWPMDEAFFDGYIFVGVFLVLHALTFTVLEAFCVSQLGNTPGKALMGIRIRNIIAVLPVQPEAFSPGDACRHGARHSIDQPDHSYHMRPNAERRWSCILGPCRQSSIPDPTSRCLALDFRPRRLHRLPGP